MDNIVQARPVVKRSRRRRKSVRAQLLISAAKAVRAEKLSFEREASSILSDALGFEVTVKIKRQRLGEGMPPAHRKAARKTTKEVRRELADQLNGAIKREIVADDMREVCAFLGLD